MCSSYFRSIISNCSQSALDHTGDLRFVDTGVLIAALLFDAQGRKMRVREVGAVVRPEELHASADVAQQFPRCLGHVGSALAPERVQPTHARRVIVEQDHVQSLTGRCDVPGVNMFSTNALQGKCLPR